MKIKAVNTYLVRPRWGFVEICTDDGLCGWGEAVLEGHAATVPWQASTWRCGISRANILTRRCTS